MQLTRPATLSIAGFDPSGGAGVLADMKTFEQLGVYGLAACSALTYQTDRTCTGLQWLEYEEIIRQCEPLLERFEIEWIKVGLIQDLNMLLRLIEYSEKKQSGVKFIWDPIITLSSGHRVHSKIDPNELKKVCSKITLITPNTDELRLLIQEENEETACRTLSTCCAVLLKGGHRAGTTVRDELHYNKTCHIYNDEWIPSGTKHGSGCVLSAALCAYLAKGFGLKEACAEARKYVRKFLGSSTQLVGFHAA